MALRLAGRYLCETGESAAEYLGWLEKEPFKELGSGEHQQENAALLLRRSVEQLSEEACDALRIIGTLAFAPIIRESVTVLVEDNTRRYRTTLNELVNFGLLDRSDHCWQISHALFHSYVRTELPLNPVYFKWLVRYYILFAQEQSQTGLPGYARLDRIRAHCLHLIESCLYKEMWQEVQVFVRVISTYLDRQGHWAEWQTALHLRLKATQETGDLRDEGRCLNGLGYICGKFGEYDNALNYYEQSLEIAHELSDRKEEGAILNNIDEIYIHQGKNEKALEYCKQSLTIMQEINDREGEGVTLNNIGMIYMSNGNNEKALKFMKQALLINQKIGNKAGEGLILNNIAGIYYEQGMTHNSLEYWKQSMVIHQALGDKAWEAVNRWNIGLAYEDQGELVQAEEYISHAVQIAETIGHPELKKYREGLEQVQMKQHGVEEADGKE